MELKILFTDQERCAPNWSWISDQNGWTGYHLWSILDSQVEIRKGNDLYLLHPGDCFLFDLSQNHICIHNPEHPVRLDSVYFHTTQPLRPQVFCLSGSQALSPAVHACVVHSQSGQNAAARQWLAAVVQEFLQPSAALVSAGQSRLPEDIRDWCQWIKEQVGTGFSMDALCRKTGYSKTQLSRIFNRCIGQTPYQYFMQCRIETGLSLLMHTDRSVDDIAAATGFFDAAHFSRSIRRATGRSPRQLRHAE